MRLDGLFDPLLPEAARSWGSHDEALAGWCDVLDCRPDEISVTREPGGGWSVEFHVPPILVAPHLREAREPE